MRAPAITLEALPAGYGDCLLVSCPVGASTWRLLVDTGPDETWPALRERLAAIPLDASGHRHVDQVVITHIDHDHIGAARLLFADRTLNLRFGDVWFNGRTHLGNARGVAEGEGLAAVLGAAANGLPWNLAFGGRAAALPAGAGFREVDAAPGHPRLTLLGPTPARLATLAKTWDKELLRLRRHESAPQDEPTPVTRGAGFPDLAALAATVSATDRGVPNGSSIALLLEHAGASLLLGADAFPNDLADALAALATHRGIVGPLAIDAYKVSHHGSRANLTAALLQRMQARHYLISTNNAVFGLPNDEALARIVLHGGVRPTLWFNYGTTANRRWADPAVCARFGYVAKVPKDGAAGITLTV